MWAIAKRYESESRSAYERKSGGANERDVR
jgi:hypothetical protein